MFLAGKKGTKPPLPENRLNIELGPKEQTEPQQSRKLQVKVPGKNSVSFGTEESGPYVPAKPILSVRAGGSQSAVRSIMKSGSQTRRTLKLKAARRIPINVRSDLDIEETNGTEKESE